MFWALIVVTLLPFNSMPPDGTYSTYEIISQHEERLACEIALYSFIEKNSTADTNKRIGCIKTDEFIRRLTNSAFD